MSRIVSLLLRNDLLRNARKNVVLKFLFGDRITIERAIQINFFFAILYFSLTSVLPLITMNSFSFNAESVSLFYHFMLNLIIPMFLFFGLFVGTNLIFEMNVDENEQLLSLPVVIDDLVIYRLADVVIANLKSYLFFFFPLFLILYMAMSWSIGWVVLIAIFSTALALISYLTGIWFILIMAKKFPNLITVKFFVNCFLVVGMLLAILIKLFKSGYVIEGESSLWIWLGELLASNSISVWVENIVVRPFGFPLYLLVLIVCGVLIFYLWKMSSKALYVVYYKIHVSTDITQMKTKPVTSGVSFEKLNKFLRFIPSLPRIIIIKDILSFIRKSNILIGVVIFVGGLILIINMHQTSVDNPLLLALYYSSMFVFARLFLGAVGREQNNIINIKLLAPSIAKYLSARIKITILAASVVLIPLWILLILSSGSFSILSDFYRPLFLILNVMLSAMFVTYFSAAFAEFEPSVPEDSYTGINPLSMLLYWGLGVIIPLFFYRLDVVITEGIYGSISLFFLAFIGLIVLISSLLFRHLGIQRIRNYF